MIDEQDSASKVIGGVVAKWSPQGLSLIDSVASSIDSSTPEGRSKIIAIIEGEAVDGQSMVGQEIDISDYVCHAIDLEDPDTGEMMPAVRTVLVSPQGARYAYVSVGILRSLERLSYVVGHPPPWDPPVRAVMRQINTRKGRRTYTLTPVE